MTPPGWLVSVSDWPFKAAEAAVNLSNWLRNLQLPQLTGGLLTNVKQILVWFGLGPICLGVDICHLRGVKNFQNVIFLKVVFKIHFKLF